MLSLFEEVRDFLSVSLPGAEWYLEKRRPNKNGFGGSDSAYSVKHWCCGKYVNHVLYPRDTPLNGFLDWYHLNASSFSFHRGRCLSGSNVGQYWHNDCAGQFHKRGHYLDWECDKCEERIGMTSKTFSAMQDREDKVCQGYYSYFVRQSIAKMIEEYFENEEDEMFRGLNFNVRVRSEVGVKGKMYRSRLDFDEERGSILYHNLINKVYASASTGFCMIRAALGLRSEFPKQIETKQRKMRRRFKMYQGPYISNYAQGKFQFLNEDETLVKVEDLLVVDDVLPKVVSKSKFMFAKNGYCYRFLFPYRKRVFVCKRLGKFPTVDQISYLLDELNISLSRVNQRILFSNGRHARLVQDFNWDVDTQYRWLLANRPNRIVGGEDECVELVSAYSGDRIECDATFHADALEFDDDSVTSYSGNQLGCNATFDVGAFELDYLTEEPYQVVPEVSFDDMKCEADVKVGGAGDCWLALPFYEKHFDGINSERTVKQILELFEENDVPLNGYRIKYSRDEDDDFHVERVAAAFKARKTGWPLLSVFVEDLKRNQTRLVGSQTVAISAVDNAINNLKSPDNQISAEGFVFPWISDAVVKIRDECPWKLSPAAEKIATELSIPWTSKAVDTHPHPIHAALRRKSYREAMPYWVAPVTIMFMKEHNFNYLMSQIPDSTNFELKNSMFDMKDVARYASTPDSLEFNCFTFPKCDTPIAHWDEIGHYKTPENVGKFFVQNENLQMLTVTHIFPLDSLMSDKSSTPELCDWKRVDGELFYYPERDRQSVYCQPDYPSLLLARTIKVDDEDLLLYGSVVWSSANTYLQVWSRFAFNCPKYICASFETLMPMPRVFRSQPDCGPIPTKWWKMCFSYAKSVQATDKDIWAKVRQISQSDEISVDEHTMNVFVACLMEAVKYDSTCDLQTKHYSTFWESINYKTLGHVKRLFNRRWRVRYKERWGDIISRPSTINTIPLVNVRLSKNELETNKGYMEGWYLDDAEKKSWSDYFKSCWYFLRDAKATVGIEIDHSGRIIIGEQKFINLSPKHKRIYQLPHQAVIDIQARAFREMIHPVEKREVPTIDEIVEERSRLERKELFERVERRREISQLKKVQEEGERDFVSSEHLDEELGVLKFLPDETDSRVLEIQECLRKEAEDANYNQGIEADDSSSDSGDSLFSESRNGKKIQTFDEVEVLKIGDQEMLMRGFSEVVNRDKTFKTLPDVDEVYTGESSVETEEVNVTMLTDAIPNDRERVSVGDLKRVTKRLSLEQILDKGDQSLAIVKDFEKEDVTDDNAKLWGAFKNSVFKPARPMIRGNFFGETLWDRLYPKSVGKRTMLIPFREITLAPDVDYPKQDCLLKCLKNITDMNEVKIWSIMVRVFHRNESATYLEGLSENFLWPFALETNMRFDVHYQGIFNKEIGINDAISYPLDLTDGHWSNMQPKCERIQFKNAVYEKKMSKLGKKLVGELSELPTVFWKKWTPEWQRAAFLIRAMFDGTTGLIGSSAGSKYELKAFENLVENAPAIERNIAVIEGDPGCRKSSAVQKLLRKHEWHQQNVFRVILPTNILKEDWGQKLDVRSKKGKLKKPTPGWYVSTFENAIVKPFQPDVAILDEHKFSKGYLAMLAYRFPSTKHFIMLGDRNQCQKHEVNSDCLLNDPDIATEGDFYSQFNSIYLVGTWRFDGILANMVRKPAFCKTNSQMWFADTWFVNHLDLRKIYPKHSDQQLMEIWKNTLTLVPSEADVMAASGLNLNDICTYSGSQGLTAELVQIVVTATSILACDLRTWWTAFSRGRNVVVVLTNDTPQIRRRCATSGFLDMIFNKYMNNQPRYSPVKYVEGLDVDIMYEIGAMTERDNLVMAGPKSKCVNFDVVKKHYKSDAWDKFIDPDQKLNVGGHAMLSRDDPAYVDSANFRKFINDPKAVKVIDHEILERRVEERKIKTHLATADETQLLEKTLQLIGDRYERELSWNDVFSEQFPDEYVTRADAGRIRKRMVDKVKLSKRLNGSQASREVEMELRITLDKDNPLKYQPKAVNIGQYQKVTDEVSFKAGIKQRIRRADFFENDEDRKRNLIYGTHLLSRLKENAGWHIPIPFDQLLYEECVQEFSERRAARSQALKKSSLNRADPDYVDSLWAKSQLKLKDEIPPDAKPLQMIFLKSDEYLFKLGAVGVYMLKQILKHAPANVYLHAKKSFQEMSDWFATYDPCSGRYCDIDIKGYDGTQRGASLVMEEGLLRHFNIPEDLIEFYVHDKLDAHTRSIHIGLMRLSGELFTWLFNTMHMWARTVTKYAVEPGEPACYSGDDTLLFNDYQVRNDWLQWEGFDVCEEKKHVVGKGSFCSWMIVNGLVVKDPVILFLRFQAAVERGKLLDVVDGYGLEFLTIYSKSDTLYQLLDEDQLEYANALGRIFFNLHRKYGIRTKLKFDKVDITQGIGTISHAISFGKALEEVYLAHKEVGGDGAYTAPVAFINVDSE
uniref:Replicase n=1 Tax=Agaricus bisporus virus 5 TaxID=1945749 RepID=A0A1Q1N6L2_9VIRU|nr:replicase [Agaricus bisporus virus 5]